MKNIFKKAKKGFTIVELVIVIGVIGILSAILIPTFVNLNDKATKSALQSDLSAVYSQYVADAADGKVGDPDAEGAKDVKLVSQDKVAIGISDGAETPSYTYYVRKDNAWEAKSFGEGGLDSIVDAEDTEYTIGENAAYIIYEIHQA